MINICFIVLHYQINEDTKECINSILQQSLTRDISVKIIVIDNASPNKKFNDIVDEYSDYENIICIQNKENLGFAKGNNIGFMYAKKNFKPEIIVLSNNDIVIKDKKFIIKLIQDYKTNSYDIAGPKILSLMDYKNQNPVQRQYYGIKDIDKRLCKLKVLMALSYVHMDVTCQKIFVKIKRIVTNNDYDASNNMNDFQLHGAFMIFGENYINTYDGLFSGTYMYGEENILKYICKRDGLCMKYIDNVEVFHKEGSSTKAFYHKYTAQRRFYYKWSIDSCNKLREIILKDQNRNPSEVK